MTQRQIEKILTHILLILGIIMNVNATTQTKPAEYVYQAAYSQVTGLDQIQFLAINGSDQYLTYERTTLATVTGTHDLYSLENPFFNGNFSSQSTELPAHLATTKAFALLVIKERASVKYVAEQIGMSLSEEEYIAATQIAIWISIQERSQLYKIQESSVKNEAVMATVKWMSDLADEYISRKTYNMDIVSYIWPPATLSVENAEAKGNVEGNFNYYGPYSIKSSDTTITIDYTTAVDNFAIVNDINGTALKVLKVNQPFYIRFDKNLIADVEILFKAETSVADVKTFTNFLYFEKDKAIVTSNLSIGNKNSTGNVRFIKYDSITEAGIEGTVVEIRDEVNNLVATMTTNGKGEAFSPDLKIGSYYVKEIKQTEGYLLDTNTYTAVIRGNGEIIRCVSAAKPNVAMMTFYCRDQSTQGAVGGSIFEILNSKGEVVTKIGFTDSGKCANIKLEPGEYSLKETLSSTAYEMLVARPTFTAVIGEHLEVIIHKSKALSYTNFKVIDEKGNAMAETWIEIFIANGGKLLELKTNTEGITALSLPTGQYQVRVRGTAKTPPSKTESFQVLDSAGDIEVTLNLVHYDAYITGKVLDTAGEPIPGVKLVAIDDNGVEFAIATTNFEGEFKLDGVPDRAVIHVLAYRAPIGMSGEVMDGRVIIIGEENRKNLTLLSLDEYNITQETEVLRYDFYELKDLIEVTETQPDDSSPLDILQGLIPAETDELSTMPTETLTEIITETTTEITERDSFLMSNTEETLPDLPEATGEIEPPKDDASQLPKSAALMAGGIILLIIAVAVIISNNRKAKTKKSEDSAETKTRPSRTKQNEEYKE